LLLRAPLMLVVGALTLLGSVATDSIDASRRYAHAASSLLSDADADPGLRLSANIEAMSAFPAEVEEVAPFRRAGSAALPLAAGYAHLCTLGSGAQLVCLGGTAGQSTLPSGEVLAHAAAGTEHTCALRSPAAGPGGSAAAVCWGDDRNGRATPPAGATFTSVCAGYDHSCGLPSGGALPSGSGGARCWGNRADGRLSAPRGEALAALACGAHHTCAVRAAGGALVCWGRDTAGQTRPPPGAFASASAGFGHSCAVREAAPGAAGAEVLCWGLNAHGQCDVPPGAYTQVAAGFKHTCALRANDRRIVCWGDNSAGQADPPVGAFESVVAGGAFSCARRLGEDAPTVGRYPEYPLQGSAVLCWGKNSVLPGAASQHADWLFWLPPKGRRFE